MPEVSRLCLYPIPFLHRRARRMSGKNAGKIDICFYPLLPCQPKQQKKRLVKGVFNRGCCPGAEVRICRGSRMGCTRAQGEKFHLRAASGADAWGRRGRSREAPALFRLIPALCKSHFLQVRYMPAGLLSRYGCKVSSRSYI